MTDQKTATRADAMKRDKAALANPDKLEEVRDKMRRVRDLQREKADLEERIKLISAEVTNIEQKELPDLFSGVGINLLGLDPEGNLPAYTAELKPYYHANISAEWPREKQDEGFEWLETNGHGDLIKNQITITTGRGEAALAKKILAALEKLKVQDRTEVKRAVPWNTLTAFVREQVEVKKKIPPLETLGATVGRVVKLKEVKQK